MREIRRAVYGSMLVLGLAVNGCATQSRSTGPMLGYTDKNLFVIEHHDPEHGGRILGTVCAVDLQLDARLRSDGAVLTGNVTDRHGSSEGMHYDKGNLYVSPASSEQPYHVEVLDRTDRNERDIIGAIGDQETMLQDPRIPAAHGIDLKLTRASISGQLGARHFDLKVRGDDYVGSLTMNGQSMPYVVRGAGQLWTMPAAAQASILPLLMTCSLPTKMIQVVDLRQTEQPEAAPPTWLHLPHAAPRPLPQMATPTPSMTSPPSPPPDAVRPGQMAAPFARANG